MPRLPCIPVRGIGTSCPLRVVAWQLRSRSCLQEYLCRRCGATYTSLDTYKLLDRTTGIFHCEECGGQAEANIDAAGLGSASGAAASRQQLQQYAKRMTEKVEAQLRPILGARACMPPQLAGGQGVERLSRPRPAVCDCGPFLLLLLQSSWTS